MGDVLSAAWNRAVDNQLLSLDARQERKVAYRQVHKPFPRVVYLPSFSGIIHSVFTVVGEGSQGTV
jgi:hypothetical protein